MAKKIKKSLTQQEIAVIKKLHENGYNNQEIVGIINSKKESLSLHINGGRISEILKGQKGIDVSIASDEELEIFLNSSKPQIDTSPISDYTLSSILKIKDGTNNFLDIDETSIFECKENFNTDVRSLIKPLISFANNNGGYILYGVKDGSWEIVGLSTKKITDFNSWDLERLSGHILSFANCGLKINKTTYRIADKDIGILYVYRASKRPIIMNSNDGDISIGQIYYRYPACNRLIASTELDEIIEDRINSMISTTLSRHIENIIRNGIENTAILNLKTGEVEGKSGNFIIEEELLSKIQFIKEGEFVEKKGAPALKLMGNLKPITTIAEKEIEKEVEKSITIKNVIEAFVKQTIITAPKEYIKTIALDSGKWMPIHYFIRKAKINTNEAIDFLQNIKETEGKNYPQSTIDMIIDERLLKFGKKSEKTRINGIKNKEISSIDNRVEALAFLASIGELTKNDIELKYCLRLLQQIITNFWSDKEIQSRTKYCCAYLDRMFFKQ